MRERENERKRKIWEKAKIEREIFLGYIYTGYLLSIIKIKREIEKENEQHIINEIQIDT